MVSGPEQQNPQEAEPLVCPVEDSETHMVDFNLIEEIGLEESLANEMIREALGAEAAEGDMDVVLGSAIQKFKSGEILQGTVVGINKDYIVIDVGLKSEGQVSKTEFEDGDDVAVGDVIEVLLESLEDGVAVLVIVLRHRGGRRQQQHLHGIDQRSRRRKAFVRGGWRFQGAARVLRRMGGGREEGQERFWQGQRSFGRYGGTHEQRAVQPLIGELCRCL